MKKLVLIFTFFIGFTSFSQVDATYKADALELVQLQTKGQFEVMLEPYLQMLPAEKREGFLKEVKAHLPSLYKNIATIYMENYSHNEIQEILAFYNTPVGKKMIETTPAITRKSMQAAKSWGIELRPLLSKYMN